MQEKSELVPKTPAKLQATPLKISTPRTKKYREQKDSVGLKRLDFYTTGDIKSQVRAIAATEKLTADKASESLLCLGIETYLKRRIQSNTGISDEYCSLPAQSDLGSNPAVWKISPRHRLNLNNESGALHQTLTAESKADASPKESANLSGVIEENLINAGEYAQISDQALRKSTETQPNVKSRGMDRERHVIKPFDPTKPSGKLHSEILDFMGQKGYFFVEVYPFSERKFELILFQPKDGSEIILITDVSDDADLLAYLNKIRAVAETTQSLDTQIQAKEIAPNGEESV